jgi:hypothetical protein
MCNAHAQAPKVSPIGGVANVSAPPSKHDFTIGDIVQILSIDDRLVANLSESERQGILSCIGKEMTISEIDKWGGIWVGFGRTDVQGDDAAYFGQSFIVDPKRIKLVRGAGQ